MHSEWEAYKEAAIIEIQAKEKELNRSREGYADKLESIKLLKEQMKEMGQDAEFKDELFEQLSEEHNKTASNINRNAYIKRITEVIKRLKDQKKGIIKVLKDIESMQVSLNYSRETLARTDSLTEALVFEKAKKDNISKIIYKLLVDLRENYARLVINVEEQFKVQNLIRAIELKIEAVGTRTANKDINKLREDLEQLRKERGQVV